MIDLFANPPDFIRQPSNLPNLPNLPHQLHLTHQQ